MENYYETTICNYFAARRHLCLGRYDGLQGNLPLPPSPFSEEKISRSPRTTTSQILQIFRWLIATLNDVSNIQPETPQGAAIPSRCNCAWRSSSARVIKKRDRQSGGTRRSRTSRQGTETGLKTETLSSSLYLGTMSLVLLH